MKPTRTSTLAIVAVVCALAAWLLLHSVYSKLPPLPWTGVPALLVAAVAEAWTGRGHRGPGRRVRHLPERFAERVDTAPGRADRRGHPGGRGRARLRRALPRVLLPGPGPPGPRPPGRRPPPALPAARPRTRPRPRPRPAPAPRPHPCPAPR